MQTSLAKKKGGRDVGGVVELILAWRWRTNLFEIKNLTTSKSFEYEYEEPNDTFVMR